jgi:hypothetical protein
MKNTKELEGCVFYFFAEKKDQSKKEKTKKYIK